MDSKNPAYGRRALSSIAIALLSFAPLASTWAQSPEELIPFEKLSVPLRNELWEISKRPTVKCKLPDRRVNCRDDAFNYLLRRLPLASRLCEKLGIGRYDIRDLGAGKFSLDDREGAFANCELAFEEPQRVVIVARGFFQAPALPKVEGTGLIIIRTKVVGNHLEPDSRVYFKLHSKALHEVSKAFRKTLSRLLEARMDRFVSCAASLAEVVAKDPAKVAKAMTELGADEAQVKEFRARFEAH